LLPDRTRRGLEQQRSKTFGITYIPREGDHPNGQTGKISSGYINDSHTGTEGMEFWGQINPDKPSATDNNYVLISEGVHWIDASCCESLENDYKKIRTVCVLEYNRTFDYPGLIHPRNNYPFFPSALAPLREKLLFSTSEKVRPVTKSTSYLLSCA
jgi:hypothetical protein